MLQIRPLVFLLLFLTAGTASAVLAEEKTPEQQASQQIDLRQQTDLLLKDKNFGDAELAETLKPMTQLKRLTLRRLPNITAVPKVDTLRNLSLIEINITGSIFASILEMRDLTALDLRNCSGITPEQYKQLNQLPKLRDLKAGGFAVNDDILKTLIPLPNLTGLTLDDTAITASGLADYIAKSPSAKTLQLVVINKGTLSDSDLLPLNKLPKLQRLIVSDSMLTGAFLGKWAENESTRPKLKRLSLRNTLLNEENAVHLEKYKELLETDLSGTIVEAASK